MAQRPSFRLGIEEEYMLVDPTTKDLIRQPDPRFMEVCQEEIKGQVVNEYLQCQVEVGTKPNSNVAESYKELLSLRTTISQICSDFGYAPIAASTHPFATWKDQSHTPKERYDTLTSDLGLTARRLLICGMHIHIEIEDEELRIDLMNQASYFLPHLLALSCSSPFWEGEDTAHSSYRLAVFDTLPRTGLPDKLDSHSSYVDLVNSLVSTNCIEDSSKIWWDIRPSAKFPTLEQRITDICSTLRDTMGLVATYQSLIAYLYRLRASNQTWRPYHRSLITENRWKAQRYGVSGDLIDLGKNKLVPFEDLTEELIDLLWYDATELSCEDYLVRIRDIAKNGSSSDKQRKIYQDALAEGNSSLESSKKVVEFLMNEFLGT